MSDWGAPPWHVRVEPPSTPPPARADVVVVGAGLAGLSTAWHLARRGARVAVLEAGRLGAGASGRTGALVLEGTAWGPAPGADRCLATVAEVVEATGVECALRLPGCDLLAHREPGAGAAGRWRDEGLDLCVAGVEPGGTMDVGALLGALAAGAQAAGASLHQHAAATAVEPGVVRIAAGAIRAGSVVLAVNAWTAGVVPVATRMGIALTLALATEPLAPAVHAAIDLAHGRPFYTLDLPYLWGRLLPDGRAVFGAGLVWAEDGRPESVGIDHPHAVDALAALERRVRALHPALAGVRVTARWGGPIAFPDRRAPLLGEHPALPGVLVAGGCAGHGVALAVQMGRLLADAIDGRAELPAWGRFAG